MLTNRRRETSELAGTGRMTKLVEGRRASCGMPYTKDFNESLLLCDLVKDTIITAEYFANAA